VITPARPVTAVQVTDAVLAGSWVIDLRARGAFAAAHVPGTVSIEYDDRFATQVGWLVPWGDDIVLLTDTPEVLEPALRQLAALGIDDVGTHLLGADDATATAGTPSLSAQYRRADWAAFRDASRIGAVTRRRPVVVDVRQLDEWRDGHLPGALHLPLHELEQSIHRLPPGELWVYCRSGYRAGIAASLLHRAGRHVVHLDDRWDRVGELHIEVVPAAAA
jgi:rhodanese-related sulfurtransferase